jgi:signal transduction histidine kinase/FixJ family two-component response regulator
MRTLTPEQQPPIRHDGQGRLPRRRVTDRVNVARALTAAGEMPTRIATFDWKRTPLGPLEDWPISLRAAAAMVVENRFPMTLFWGPDLCHIYNDAYIPVLGGKHPAALGQPARAVWSEIWPIIGPQIDLVLAGRGAVWHEHLLLPMDRKGFREETYFTFSYSPIRDDAGAIGGILVTCQETTGQIQGERQLQMLRDLGAEGFALGEESKPVEVACRSAARVLAKNDADIPFALIYLFREGGTAAELVATAGMDGYEGPGKPGRLSMTAPARSAGWPIREARAPGSFVVVEDLANRFGPMPRGHWGTPPEQAVVLSLAGAGQTEPYGILIAGVSPLRSFDEHYKRMFQLTADQIIAGIRAARALEEERTRASALTALDHAKTAFFSNVSHEFRTPLMLMLGPTEDLLSGVHGELPSPQRAQLELLHRNATRLHKLVNALLDIARLEAGRIQPSFQRVDLAALTRELVASFQPAVERAGLKMRIDCAAIDEPAFVDRDMWEKIVLNLVSNALKFTFEGCIDVSLCAAGGEAVLRVADTGVGIAGDQIPRLFDRFFRVEGSRARTHEGSGIGLALVQELVKLHKGATAVESQLDRGTTFTVKIPLGSAHIPADRIGAPLDGASAAQGAAPFVEEALRWLHDDSRAEPEPPSRAAVTPEAKSHARILIVDDNADMRDYLRHLLERQWTVEVATDGDAALTAIQRDPPDLVLTDVMMAGSDGFVLLRRLREDRRTSAIPVVMVSARAGDEAKVEGLRAGADDYLTKPFSARELMARVETQLKLAGLRARAEEERQRFYGLLQQAPVPIIVYEGPELTIAFQNAAAGIITDGRIATGQPVLEAFPSLATHPLYHALKRVYETGRGIAEPATSLRILNAAGFREDRIFDLILQPLRDDQGEVVGVIGVAFEITAQVRAREEIEKSEARFRAIFVLAEVSIWEEDLSQMKRFVDHLRATLGPGLRAALEENPSLLDQAMALVRIRDVNPATLRMFGATSNEQLITSFRELIVPGTSRALVDILVSIAAGERIIVGETHLRKLNGEPIDVAFTLAFAADDAACERVLVTLTDVSAQKLAAREREARITEMERAVHFGEMFAGILGHDLRNPLSAITTAAGLLEARADSERIARPARRVVASANRMERMISQLLDFTRIRLGGGLPIERTRVDLTDIARSIIDELEPVHQRTIWLRADGDVIGHWDRDLLSQLLSNLAANACQHGTPGVPVDIILDGTRPDVVGIDVHNDGVIPPELLPSVFEPLHPGADHHQKRGGSSGLGLGLYITQQIVLAHGGAIRVVSTEAVGTRLIVELPREKA